MPKFYVESGDVQHISSQETAKEAALDLIRTSERTKLSPIVTVSERSFDSGQENEVWFDSKDLVEEIEAFERPPVEKQ